MYQITQVSKIKARAKINLNLYRKDKKEMIAIVNADLGWGIGKDGALLNPIPEDTAFFKETTMGGTVIMGRKTLETLPGAKPLRGRRNIIVSRQKLLIIEGAEVYTKSEDAIRAVQYEEPDKVFVIGGEEIYRGLIDFCSTALVTRVLDKKDADVTFPDLDKAENWSVESESEEAESGGVKYKFVTYKNSAVKTYE